MHLMLGSELSRGLCDRLDEVADVTGQAWGTFLKHQIAGGRGGGRGRAGMDSYLGDLHYQLLSRISPGGRDQRKGLTIPVLLHQGFIKGTYIRGTFWTAA